MNSEETIIQLKNIIKENLTPLIKSNYILLDVPYHGNIGDTFIWQGERDFLSTLSFKELDEGSLSWPIGKHMENNTTILLHGGGNFGDLYRKSQEFRLNIISTYKDNPIVIFPQSVWYSNRDLVECDAKIISSHSNLTLCARDQYTYDYFKKEFPSANIVLVPDMAFYIDTNRLSPFINKKLEYNELYIRRIDKELQNSTPPRIGNAVLRDWPTLEKPSNILNFLFYFNRGLARTNIFFKKIAGPVLQSLSKKYILERQVKLGFELLSPYSKVYTTRLHAMIGAILLHKPVEYIDNSTGKISSFVSTWLKDLDSVNPYSI